jgi:integrase/recombinase XerD
MDSNSIGGILIPQRSPYNIPMVNRPRTKALKDDQLKDDLKGDLAAYEKFGLFQRSVNRKTAYRYRGALLRYQLFLGKNPPCLAATYEYLGMLRKSAFDPSTLRIYRAALAGFHQWRGEELKFKVKVPETSAKYVPWEIIKRMLKLSSAKPHDQMILRLMTDAGLRRDEIVQLRISNIEGNKLRFRGKGSKERTVPMTDELKNLVNQFSAHKPKDASLIELGEKGVYLMVKRYGALAGMPEITPHDLRRAFGTHLLNVTGNIRIVQEILGHSNVNTTQAYTAVTINNMEEAIKKLHSVVNNDIKKRVSQTDDGTPVETRQDINDETSHKQQIQNLVKELLKMIHLPSLLDDELWKSLTLEFQQGTYSLPTGVIEIDKANQITVYFHDIGLGIAEPHLVKGLHSHLQTSGLSKFMELEGKNRILNNWLEQTGQFLQMLLILLKIIVAEIKDTKTRNNFRKNIKPGLKQMFPITICNDVLEKIMGNRWIDNSWYQPPENISGTNLWQLKCGAYTIGIATSRKTLETYKNWHKKLRTKYLEHKSVKNLYTKSKELNKITQEIRQRLQEFSDMGHLPGNCELC